MPVPKLELGNKLSKKRIDRLYVYGLPKMFKLNKPRLAEIIIIVAIVLLVISLFFDLSVVS